MKKRMLSLVLALVLCLGLAVPALAAEDAVVLAVPCEFWFVMDYSEGLAAVAAGEYCGFIDKTGEFVIPAAYDDARSFSEGLAAVSKNEKWGFIDKTGKEVIPFDYDAAVDFSEGLAGVSKGEKWGFIDKTGKMVIPCEYDDVREKGFSEGVAGVKKGKKWGFINKIGKENISFEYDGVLDFSDGLVGVMKNGKCGYIDKTGTEIVPCKYEENDSFFEGLALVKQSGKYGFIDKTGKEVIPCRLDGAGFFSDGLAAVKQGDEWGFMDKTGNVVIDCKYADVQHFSEGYAPVMVWFDGPRRAWGYIDKTGKEVVSPHAGEPEDPDWYVSANPCMEGMARVSNLVPIPDDPGYYHDIYGYLAFPAIEESSNEPVEVTAKISNWAKELVDSAAASGLVAEGLGDDYTRSITRAQFAAVSVKLYEAMSGEKTPAAGDSPFTDTSDPAVIQAEALGFVGGVGGGKFDPNSLVTREQAAVMLSRVYTKLGGEIPAVDATNFADNGDMSGYARDAIAFMSGKEIVGGVGNNKFDPQGNASIEQALVIALRMFEKLK